jgi:hypothetical protein
MKTTKRITYTEFMDWLNHWADLFNYPEHVKEFKLTDFGKGYKQAVRDIRSKSYENFDKKVIEMEKIREQDDKIIKGIHKLIWKRV